MLRLAPVIVEIRQNLRLLAEGATERNHEVNER
jgi:hypothetical protein